MKDVEANRFFEVAYNCLLLAEGIQLVFVSNVLLN